MQVINTGEVPKKTPVPNLSHANLKIQSACTHSCHHYLMPRLFCRRRKKPEVTSLLTTSSGNESKRRSGLSVDDIHVMADPERNTKTVNQISCFDIYSEANSNADHHPYENPYPEGEYSQVNVDKSDKYEEVNIPESAYSTTIQPNPISVQKYPDVVPKTKVVNNQKGHPLNIPLRPSVPQKPSHLKKVEDSKMDVSDDEAPVVYAPIDPTKKKKKPHVNEMDESEDEAPVLYAPIDPMKKKKKPHVSEMDVSEDEVSVLYAPIVPTKKNI